MRICINTPEIVSLRDAVERRHGLPLRTPRHFLALSEDIMETLREYLSETTLQRVWQYKAGYKTVAVHTLNVLSRYAGCSSWELFCSKLKESGNTESELFSGDSIDVARLRPGTLVRISWLPDRVCVVRYLGDYRFEAIDTHNCKLAAGDRFTCTRIQKGREMFLDNLVRENNDMQYVIGTRNGLTNVEIIEST